MSMRTACSHELCPAPPFNIHKARECTSFWRVLERKMAVRLKLVRDLALFLLLFCVWKAPLRVSKIQCTECIHSSNAGRETNMLFAGDVALNLHHGVNLLSFLAGIRILVCLLGCAEVEKVCRLDESNGKIILKITQR